MNNILPACLLQQCAKSASFCVFFLDCVVFWWCNFDPNAIAKCKHLSESFLKKRQLIGWHWRQALDNLLRELVTAFIFVNFLNLNRGVREGLVEKRFRVVRFPFLNGDFNRLYAFAVALFRELKQLVRSGVKT